MSVSLPLTLDFLESTIMIEPEMPAGAPPDPQASWTKAEWDEFKDLLYRFNCDCGAAGPEDRARVLIAFCIGEGIIFLGRIINLIAPLGFDKRYLAMLMKQDKGGWFRVGRDNIVSHLNG